MKEDNDLPLDVRIHPKYPNLYITESIVTSQEYIGCILLFRNPNDKIPIKWCLCLLSVKTSGTQKMITELTEEDFVRMSWGSERDMERIRQRFTPPRVLQDYNNGLKQRWYEMWKQVWMKHEIDSIRDFLDVKKKMNEMSGVPKDLTTSDTSDDTKLHDIQSQDNTTVDSYFDELPTEKDFHKPVQQPKTIYTKLKDKIKIKLGHKK